MDFEISQQEFEQLRTFIYKHVGISLGDHKATMVRGRLAKRLRQLGLDTFHEYYEYLTGPGGEEEISQFINAISTNVTSFFRSPKQWEWLAENINVLLAKKKEKRIRIWCAASSSGEEPYTIAIFLKEHLKDFDKWDIKILATDISKKVLAKASAGIYTQSDIGSMNPEILKKYFNPIRTDRGETQYQIIDSLRGLIMFRIFNLVTDKFIFRNKFDIIFCRNVMIYFDEPTRHELIRKFATLLDKGSLLLLGDSEAITTNRVDFSVVRAAIYKRN